MPWWWWVLVTVIAAFGLLVVFAAGFIYGTHKEHEAAEERLRLARRYRIDEGYQR